VLGKKKGACLQDQDPVVEEFIGVEEVLGEGSAEGTATDDYDVESPRIRTSRCASKSLIETVTYIAA